MTGGRLTDLRVSAIFAIPLALIVVIPLLVGFYLYRDITNDRLVDSREAAERNRDLIDRVDTLRYEECLDNELRDSVVVIQLQATIARARATLPPGALLRSQVETLRDGIATLEPIDEEECEPPEETGP